jgi:hypothetical protein
MIERERKHQLDQILAEITPNQLHEGLISEGYVLEADYNAVSSGPSHSLRGAKLAYSIEYATYPVYVKYWVTSFPARFGGGETKTVSRVISLLPAEASQKFCSYHYDGCPELGLSQEEAEYFFASILQPKRDWEEVKSVFTEMVDALGE